MKTTNFFIDFIVVGLIGIFAVGLPVAMMRENFIPAIMAHADVVLKLTPVLTVAVYAWGVLYNQVSDRVDDILSKCIPLSLLCDVRTEQKKLEAFAGMSDHDCIQYIVLRSPAAYEYLSFRRSVLRIIRALLSMCLLVPLAHGISILYFGIVGQDLEVSAANSIILSILCVMAAFMVYTLRKLGIGYFRAVRSFYGFLVKDPPQRPASLER